MGLGSQGEQFRRRPSFGIPRLEILSRDPENIVLHSQDSKIVVGCHCSNFKDMY